MTESSLLFEKELTSNEIRKLLSEKHDQLTQMMGAYGRGIIEGKA
jgi:hypothetical protein